MIVIDREIQRRVAVAIFDIWISAALHQQFRDGQAVGASRNVQWLILVLVDRIDLRLVVKQDLGRLHGVGFGRLVQWGVAFEAVLVDV